MNLILPRLYLGSFEDGQEAYLQAMAPLPGELPIQYIVNLSERGYDSPVRSLHLPITDEVFLPAHLWQERVDVLSHFVQHKGTVLVHCRLGVSRAPTLVAAYLCHTGYTPDTALAFLKERRQCVNPHVDTWRSMVEWWEGKQIC